MAGLTVDLWPHPLTAEGRACRELSTADGASLAEFIALLLPGPYQAQHVDAALDGVFVPHEEWAARRLRDGQIVTLRRRAAGGAIRELATIAVVAAAFVFAPALAGAVGISVSAAQAGILIGGTLVVNALVPVRGPDVPDFVAASPSAEIASGRGYAIPRSSNRERPQQPLLLVLGRHRVYPDRVTEATVRAGDDGNLYSDQILSWGIGDLDIGDLQYGTTPLTTLGGVTQQTYLPGATPYTAESRISRTQRIDLDVTATDPVVRQLDPRAIGAVALVRTRLGYTADNGSARSRSVEVNVDGGADTQAVQHTYSGSSYAVEEHEIAYTPAASDEDTVRLWRTAAAVGDARTADELRYVALRSLLVVPSGHDRSADTWTSISIRLSEQIGGALDPIHAIVGQRVPVWRNGAWTDDAPEVSTSPAAIFRAFARGWRNADGVPLAGGQLSDDWIDHDNLGEWSEWCRDHIPELTCSLVLTGPTDVARVLELIARCGRASPTWQTGRLGVVFERDRTPSMFVSPQRIIADSLEVDWASGPVADEVVYRYVDPAREWGVFSERALAPGAPTATRTVTIDGTGVVSRVQASYLAGLQAAHQAVHRRRIAWEMGREGLSLGRGDVLYLSHDLVTGGETGRLQRVSGADVTLNREVDAKAGETLLLSRPSGDLIEGEVVAVSTDADGVSRVTLDVAPELGDDAVSDVAWRHYSAGASRLKVQVVKMIPRSGERVRIEAIDETDRYTAVPADDEITIRFDESTTHTWAVGATSAIVWLVSGTGGDGGDGGAGGARGASGSSDNTGTPGGYGGYGGVGGQHADGGTALNGNAGGSGSSGLGQAGGGGGGGGGGGAGGNGGETTVAVAGMTHSSGVGPGGDGGRGRNGVRPSHVFQTGRAGRGGNGAQGPAVSMEGRRAVRSVRLDGLHRGTVLRITIGGGGWDGGDGARGGNGAANYNWNTRNRPARPAAPTARGESGYAVLSPL